MAWPSNAITQGCRRGVARRRSAAAAPWQNIADTHADGQPRYGVYVEKRIVDGRGSKMVQFRFSTQKVKNAVVLLIEQLKEMDVEN